MLRLFFFSGTGNARNVAQWLCERWRERGRHAEAIDISRLDGRGVQIAPGDEVGLASPTHGFNFPPITLAFLFALPRARHGNRAFIVNTRAGLRLFGVHLPGLSGVAQLLAALILLWKGYRIVGMRPMDLPSNWISLHPGLHPDNVNALYDRCEKTSRCFAERLLDDRRDLRALWDLPIDLILAPLALSYYFIGRFLFAKSFFASHACDGCAACVTQCPVKAVRMTGGRPFWSYRCESCMRCMNQCPRRAIQTAHGFITLVLLAVSTLLTSLIYPALHAVVPTAVTSTGVLATTLRWVAEPAMMLVVLFLSYRLLHRGLRTRVVERLAMVTSLTRFSMWRRYRAPRMAARVTCEDEHGDRRQSGPVG